MMQPCFRHILLAILMALPSAVGAQVELVSSGDVIAHGVRRCGTMPDALRVLLAGRTLQTVNEPWNASERLRARSLIKGYVHAPATTVGPLLLSIRDQSEPYNMLCPYWTEDSIVSEKRCLTGCVATAIEQVMAYYRYPEELLDTLHGWSTDNYTLDDMLPGTRFDWDNYLYDYRDGWTEEQGRAIALPLLACGMAVHMNYGIYASGANVYRALEPLKRAFGYGMTRYVERVLYTPTRWHAMLRHELDEGRPIVYTGHNMAMGGHAFNIDGYDAAGYYHVNWGYNGDYDGWYDLDWLNPWEIIDLDPQGIAEGFFCNQTALFMNPSADAQPLEQDTLSLPDLGVRLEAVRFLRKPDIKYYVMADFDFVHEGTDTVTYTFEVMTNLPTDTALFEQADYIGLSGFTIAPGERLTQRVYLQFSEPGDRILGISDDDVTIPFQLPVHVSHGTQPKLTWGAMECGPFEQGDTEADGFRLTATVPVTNTAAAGFAGNLITFCLMEDGVKEDQRHYHVLSTPAGETEMATATYTHLKPSTHYRLIARCPWPIQAEAEFTTPALSAVGGVKADNQATDTDAYDLSGRKAIRNYGIIIRHGRKTAHR